MIQARLLSTVGTTLAALTAIAGLTGPARAQETPVAITGARIIPITGDEIAKGTLVVQGGKIVSVGAADAVQVPAGAVISSSPAQGEQVPRDTPVSLVVSSGRPALGVPNVVGRTQQAATNQLGDAGFVVGQILQQGTPDDPDDGKVVAQDPAPNTLLKPGQVVTITVRRAATATTVPGGN